MADNCSLFLSYDLPFRSIEDISRDIEHGNVDEKYEALKEVVLMHMNGQPQMQLLIHIIKFLAPNPSKKLKKLLCYYWEVIPKRDEDGKLREEIMLICERLRKDLLHSNEYVRGSTLRVLSKIMEVDIIEYLVTTIIETLQDRFAYVRKNAIFTVYAIMKNEQLKHLIPDGTDLIFEVLKKEQDVSTKRNAFLMLQDCAPSKASIFLKGIIDEVSTSGQGFQLEILRLMKDLAKTNPREKPKYLRIISNLISSKSNAVIYQCANTLVDLSNSPAAIRRAAECYTKLLLTETDNNIRIIAFERIVFLKDKYPKYLKEVVSDLLRILKTVDFDIKMKILSSLVELVTPSNIIEVTSTLKSELMKSIKQKVELEKGKEYRTSILKVLGAIVHSCFELDGEKNVIRIHEGHHDVYFEVMKNVFVVLDFLGDSCGLEAMDITKEIIHHVPELRTSILDKLYSNLCDIRVENVYREAIWTLSEYSETKEEVLACFDSIYSEIAPILYTEEEEKMMEQSEGEETEGEKEDDSISINSSISSTTGGGSVYSTHRSSASKVPRVNADGTYVTQTAEGIKDEERFLKATDSSSEDEGKTSLVRLIRSKKKHFYLYIILSMALTKMVLRLEKLGDGEEIIRKKSAEVLLIICALVRVGGKDEIDPDTMEKLHICVNLLMNRAKFTGVRKSIEEGGRVSYGSMLIEEKRSELAVGAEKVQNIQRSNQPDSMISISQLLSKNFDAFAAEDDYAELNKITDLDNIFVVQKTKLGNVVQLTGCGDPVYAEATITSNEFDIILDILIVNQMKGMLKDISIELSTKGDLEICEQPSSYNLEGGEKKNIRVNVKVTSTETGSIFGNILYTPADGTKKRNYIVLSEIPVDIMDYILPAECTETEFREMWKEFEWENKIVAKFLGTDMSVLDFLNELKKITKMKVLTPESYLRGDIGFLSANLYSKSMFGEDALINLSIEKSVDRKLEGIIRIRSKTQGIAKSLGKQIKNFQNNFEAKKKKEEQKQ